MLHGQCGAPIFTVIALEEGTEPGGSIFPESSKPRTCMVTGPIIAGVHVKFQLVVPSATFHVRPPAKETSIPATTLSSEDVPPIVTGANEGNDEPLEAEVIVVTGAIWS